MSVGIEVKNDSGSIVINDTSPLPLSLRDKVTYTAGVDHDFTSSVLPIVAGPGTGWMVKRSSGPSDWRATFSDSGPLYIFSAAPAAPISFGLEIYNAEGVRQFTSVVRPFRVADVLISNDIDTLVGDHMYVAGRTYAAVISSVGFKLSRAIYTPGVGYLNYYWYPHVLSISGGLRIGKKESAAQAFSNGPPDVPVRIFVIDVSHY